MVVSNWLTCVLTAALVVFLAPVALFYLYMAWTTLYDNDPILPIILLCSGSVLALVLNSVVKCNSHE